MDLIFENLYRPTRGVSGGAIKLLNKHKIERGLCRKGDLARSGYGQYE